MRVDMKRANMFLRVVCVSMFQNGVCPQSPFMYSDAFQSASPSYLLDLLCAVRAAQSPMFCRCSCVALHRGLQILSELFVQADVPAETL